jgi:hypothetical protein
MSDNARGGFLVAGPECGLQMEKLSKNSRTLTYLEGEP